MRRSDGKCGAPVVGGATATALTNKPAALLEGGAASAGLENEKGTAVSVVEGGWV